MTAPPTPTTSVEDLVQCEECRHDFDLEVEGGTDEHTYRLLCGQCLAPCHCPACDPDAATDLAMDAAREW